LSACELTAPRLREVLERTLAYVASEVKFYRGRLPANLRLEDFPLIDRDVVQKHFSDFLVARRFPDFLVMSGGTTGDIVNATIRNEEEYDAVHEYLYGIKPGEYLGLDNIDGFGVDVFFNTNGYTRRKPRGWPLVSVPLERKAHVDLIAKLLTQGFDLGSKTIPARYLQCQNSLHRVLAGYFAAADQRPGNLGLMSVFGYGSHISRVWHKRLKELWGHAPDTAYGLSEFIGANAVRCSECGSLHYLTAWQEFLSPEDYSPVEQGDAVLVLTSLVPFVTVQPRVRYVTHDVVSIQGRCNATGLVGFRFRGRLASTVWDPHHDRRCVLLSEVDLIEVLDQLDGIYGRPHPSEIQLWEDSDLPVSPFRMGLPQFTINSRGRSNSEIEIEIEVVFDPDREPTRAHSLKERLIALLCVEVPRLAELMKNAEVRVNLELRSRRGLGLRPKLSA
jgi:hypothetical protein